MPCEFASSCGVYQPGSGTCDKDNGGPFKYFIVDGKPEPSAYCGKHRKLTRLRNQSEKIKNELQKTES